MKVKWYITFRKDFRIKELHFLTPSSVICPTKWTNTRKYTQYIETLSNLPPETDELTLKKLITSSGFRLKAIVFNCMGGMRQLSFGKTIGIYNIGLSIDFFYHSGFVLNYGWKDLKYSRIKPLTERHCKRLFLEFYNYKCNSPFYALKNANCVEFNEALPQLIKKEYFDFYVEKCSDWGEIVDSGEFTC